jgi:hypothetical protein
MVSLEMDGNRMCREAWAAMRKTVSMRPIALTGFLAMLAGNDCIGSVECKWKE